MKDHEKLIERLTVMFAPFGAWAGREIDLARWASDALSQIDEYGEAWAREQIAEWKWLRGMEACIMPNVTDAVGREVNANILEAALETAGEG